MRYLALVFSLLLSPTLYSNTATVQDYAFCSEALKKLPVQAGGRVKPLIVLANETFKFMTNTKKPYQMDRVTAFCVFSLMAFEKNNDLEIQFKIEHIEAKKILNISEDSKSIPANKLLSEEQNLRASHFSIKESTPLKKELQKLLLRIQTYKELTSGSLWSVAVKDNELIKWIPIKDIPFEELEAKLKAQDQLLKAQGPQTYDIEYTYFQAKPFSYAMLFVLLAIFCIVIFKKNTAGFIFSGLVILLQVLGITLRIYISGRAPITNMYETVMFSGFGALVISCFLTYLKKDKIFILGGLSYNMLCLLMMTFANNMLDPSIKPLVPVLRDNFWLSTHVTTIILSYAALALSWILANIVIIKRTFFALEKGEEKRQSKIIYICVQVGIVLLSAGIILGGVWADYSWGRFWGWDPKETWSLIVLLAYMAILHGKYSSWINDKNFIPLIAAAFMSVMMAWFGVNYILATGLHSYGFSEGGAIFLGSFFLVQVLILLYAQLKTKGQGE